MPNRRQLCCPHCRKSNFCVVPSITFTSLAISDLFADSAGLIEMFPEKMKNADHDHGETSNQAIAARAMDTVREMMGDPAFGGPVIRYMGENMYKSSPHTPTISRVDMKSSQTSYIDNDAYTEFHKTVMKDIVDRRANRECKFH